MVGISENVYVKVPIEKTIGQVFGQWRETDIVARSSKCLTIKYAPSFLTCENKETQRTLRRAGVLEFRSRSGESDGCSGFRYFAQVLIRPAN